MAIQKIEYLSASKLKTFRNCPYSLNDKFVKSEATNFGEAVHYGIAEFMKSKGEFLPSYRKKAAELAVPLGREQDAIKCFNFVESMNIDKDAIITVESEDGEAVFYDKTFFQVPFTQNWGMRGAMDLVTVDDKGGLIITDWKTGKVEEEDDLQLAIYALCAWKKYGKFPYIKTLFAYVSQGYQRSSVWDAESLVGALDYLKFWAEKFLKAQKEGNLPQTPHKYCKYCGLKDSCKAYNEQLANKPYAPSYDIEATVENLPKILEYYDKAKAIADAAYAIQQQLKEKYESVLSESGKVNIGGRYFELKEKVSRYNYNLQPIFAATQELIGRPPLELCEYSGSGAKEIEKLLDKENKKIFKGIIEANREVKTLSKTLSVTIAKEASQITDQTGEIVEAVQ